MGLESARFDIHDFLMSAQTNWGIAATVLAPPATLARFAAYHLDLGAARIDLYCDGPTPDLTHPRLFLHPGSQDHDALHRRQMANIRHAYQASSLPWLAHLDVDEFILPLGSTPLAQALADVPEGCDTARLMAVEQLADGPPGPSHFKRPPPLAKQPRSVLEDLYPDYGLHLRSGLLSHSEGKGIFRVHPDLAPPGIHRRRSSKPHETRLSGHVLGHTHAPSWAAFQSHLPRRLADTSYSATRGGTPPIADLLAMIEAEEGTAGLRQFFETLCSATPDHLARLKNLGMLFTHDLRLDTKARKLFPDIPL